MKNYDTSCAQGFSCVTILLLAQFLGGQTFYYIFVWIQRLHNAKYFMLSLNHTLLHLLGTTSHCQWLSHTLLMMR